MSLFRKPKKIQRRVFCADDDEEAELDVPPPPVISQIKKENKPVKSTPLLSFVDEEEEVEVFKVKKSSQSKKLARKREKEKRQVPDGDNNKFDSNDNEEKLEIKSKSKKKVTLEGLILSGREALAADGTGDVSDEEESVEDEDSRGFHQYRPETVRAALAVAPGHIPDAALIHAARKTRQQARELGGDYIPVQSEPGSGSRLVRDDGSGDDEEEGRIHVRGLDLPSDKPKRGTAAAPTNEEMDSEVEEWEEQQMQKAMPAIVDITGEGIEVNPFAVAPPPPRLDAAPPHLRPLVEVGAAPPASAQELLDSLRKRVEELRRSRVTRAARRASLSTRLENAAAARQSCGARTWHLDAAYRRAQATRGYLTDLIECLDEKLPELEALEARALAMHRRRCEFIMERRRADVRDQAQDLLAMTARPGSMRGADSEEKVRRGAEREGRRRARRLRREAAGGAGGRHRDGDSSDDELPPAEHQHFTHEREAIRAASMAVFADALPAWRDVGGVCARLARWRAREPALYSDAYVGDCLPRLLAPYVRHQLILWNPMADEDNEDYERMDWYKSLMMYGVRAGSAFSGSDESDVEMNGDSNEVSYVSSDTIRDDPDLMLVPSIISKVVLPKLTELVEQAWDPMSVRACVRLRQLVVRACSVPDCTAALQRLGRALRSRLAASLQADVFLPALPPLPSVVEGSGGAFWRRCLGSGVRLLRAVVALSGPPGVLRADPLAVQLLETLSRSAGLAPPQLTAGAAAALAESVPRSGNRDLRARALARLAALASQALSRLSSDNPLHLKALEQARSVIAEAKALE